MPVSAGVWALGCTLAARSTPWPADLAQRCAHDDDLAEAQPIDLPGVAAGGFDPQATGDGAVTEETVERRPRRYDERHHCWPFPLRDRARTAKERGPDDTWALVGGQAEPQRFQRQPRRRAGGIHQVGDTTPGAAREHPHRPGAQRDAAKLRGVEQGAARGRAVLTGPQYGKVQPV